MENMNLSDKSREALKSETWQEIREDMKEEIVSEYLKNGYADGEKQHDISVSGIEYKVLERGEVTTFYDNLGNTLFSVENEKLAAKYEEMAGGDSSGAEHETENEDSGPNGEDPDPAELEEKSDGGEEPAKCITGKSKSGICGAAAYCSKGLKCCSECSDPCNSHCGWLNADEESPIDEAPNETEKAAEDFKEKACDKLREELKKADDKQFADPVIGYLLKRCGEDNGLAQDVMQKHKTWKKCSQYIFEQARKQAKGGHAAVRDDVVYEWAEDYYHKDDKAEEEKKAKQEAEANARRERAAANRKTSEKKLASQEAGTYSQKEKTENKPAKEQAKPKKNGKELEGQMDLFSMMDMLGGGSDE